MSDEKLLPWRLDYPGLFTEKTMSIDFVAKPSTAVLIQDIYSVMYGKCNLYLLYRRGTACPQLDQKEIHHAG